MSIGFYKISVDEDLPSTYQCFVKYGESVGVSKELKINAILSSDGKGNNNCTSVMVLPLLWIVKQYYDTLCLVTERGQMCMMSSAWWLLYVHSIIYRLWHASVLLSAGDRCLQYSIHKGHEQNKLNCLADPFATYSGKMNLFGKCFLDIYNIHQQ